MLRSLLFVCPLLPVSTAAEPQGDRDVRVMLQSRDSEVHVRRMSRYCGSVGHHHDYEIVRSNSFSFTA